MNNFFLKIAIVGLILTLFASCGEAKDPNMTNPQEQTEKMSVGKIIDSFTGIFSKKKPQPVEPQPVEIVEPEDTTVYESDTINQIEPPEHIEITPVLTPKPTPKPPQKQTPASNEPTTEKLNSLLGRVANSDDHATDEIRKVLGNSLKVEGATHISNVQELIIDVSNGSNYKITNINKDEEGKMVSISVVKR